MQLLKLLKFPLCALLLAAPVVAYADQVDCSSASHFSTEKDYKKGDRVWYHDGGNLYSVYSCDKDKCHGGGDHDPKWGSAHDWTLVGTCSKAPS